MDNVEELPLRERKRLRTREALIDAAMELFAERGFEAVTVSDIARRAEVGRTTFFRYFADKQEVLFADDSQHREALLSAVDRAAAGLAPIGDSLERALTVGRAGLLALVASITEHTKWMAERERLINADAALLARSLLKQRAYAIAAVEALERHGADHETAVLASALCQACYETAVALTAAEPSRLAGTLEAAFDRVAGGS
ncbi:TetR family transcriptional regulator [Streptomyces sp. HC44]|uniref:TetR family transcriptional regulator n=1 Tax=Streptomyces scabichelini TaxID=2711217 RepID=A0A6G4UXQ7_9ACTN|nr:TetR family transcriptional regulator [Streptomyces scabichelini]NGO06558.1 TetR family transcriptional regulator [Streptomyces scabichelini]